MSRARDLANGITTLAPLASPDFTGTVDLTGTTVNLDNDQISGDKVSGGTIGAGTFDGTIGSSATFPAGHVLQQKRIVDNTYSADAVTSWNSIFTGIQITNVTSGSKVMIQACITFLVESSGQGAFRIIRASDSTVLGHAQHTTGGNGNWRNIMPTIIVEDTSPSAGTNNYTLQKRSSGITIYYNYENNTHEGSRSFFLLTELTQ